MNITVGVLLVSAVVLMTSVSTNAQPISCPQSSPDTADWIRYDEGDFSVKLPPHFESVEAESVDSQVGRWESGNAFIYYDFGIYSNPLDPKKQGTFSDMTVCQQSKGRSPRIVVYRSEADGTVRLGAHWPAPSLDVFHRTALTLVGTASDRYSRAELLAVIQSVQWIRESE